MASAIEENPAVNVSFEQQGSDLTAVEIKRNSRRPVIVSLHRALFALGIVVSSYQVRPGPNGLVERMVLARQDGGTIQGSLSDATRAAILPLVALAVV